MKNKADFSLVTSPVSGKAEKRVSKWQQPRYSITGTYGSLSETQNAVYYANATSLYSESFFVAANLPDLRETTPFVNTR